MSNDQLSDIQKKLLDFNVKKLSLEGNLLKLQIQIEKNIDLKVYEKIIKERLPDYIIQLIFFTADNEVKKFKKIIGISSGKGGVGKSIISLNLAFSLRDLGYSVGILDADIYTPSIPGLLGLNENPISKDGVNIEPISSHGIDILSMGLFLKFNQSPLWQDNMIDASFRQFLLQGAWNCDYLIIDFGAGINGLYDLCLQLIPNIELILIANPNCMIYRDVFRMYAFLSGLKLNVIGVIDNMSNSCYQMENIPEFNGQKIPNLGFIPFFDYYINLIENGYPKDYKLSDDKKYFDNIIDKIL